MLRRKRIAEPTRGLARMRVWRLRALVIDSVGALRFVLISWGVPVGEARQAKGVLFLGR